MKTEQEFNLDVNPYLSDIIQKIARESHNISSEEIELFNTPSMVKHTLSMIRVISLLFTELEKSMTLDFLQDLNIIEDRSQDIIHLLGADAYRLMQKLLYSSFAHKERLTTENKYQNKLFNKFNEIFPSFTLVKKEYVLKDGDRIDILAKCNVTARDVIIELKIGAKSGRKQLRSYATHFNNPILISISEQLPLKITDDISYYTYNYLGINISDMEVA